MRSLLLTLCLVLALPAAAQAPFVADLEARLAPMAPSEFGRFGVRVEVDGDRAIVSGRPGADTEYILFARENGDWVQELNVSLPRVGTSYESGVALDGDVAVLGHPNAGEGTTSTGGVAYVYERQGGSWVQTAALAPGSLSGSAGFGSWVDIDGDRILVSAPDDDEQRGAAFVFGRSGSSWIQTARLEANDAAVEDRFGSSVALDGDRLLIGAPADDDRGEDSGSAYVFERDGGQWVQTDKLRPGANTAGASFGVSVALRGDQAAIGAFGEIVGGVDRAGAVYAFGRSGGSWQLTERLTRAQPAEFDFWGFRLDLEADRLIVGALSIVLGTGVDVLGRSGDGWTLETVLAHPDGETDSQGTRGFGRSVALDGQRAIIGAPNEDQSAPAVRDAGAAYIFDLGAFVSEEPAPPASAASLSAPAPNPTRDRATLTLSLAAPGRAVAVLHDALGRRVAVLLDAEVNGSVRLDVPTADLAPGVYAVRVETAGGGATRRLSVVR